jgi:hypothetical protein
VHEIDHDVAICGILHYFFPLLWITILKYNRLYVKIEIRVAKFIG